MNIKNQTGFTLVEVMIVLAISALLASSVLIWQGSVNEHARYSDAMEDTTSRLSEMRGQVFSSLNESTGVDCDGSSGGDSGSHKDCVVFAKAMQFDENTGDVNVRTFVADRAGEFNDNMTGISEIGIMRRNHQLKWGVEFEEGELVKTGKSVDTIVITRDFKTGHLEIYSLNSGDGLTDMDNYTSNARGEAEFRFVNDKGRGAALHINESSNSIRRSFE